MRRLIQYVDDVMRQPTREARRRALQRVPAHLQPEVKQQVERLWKAAGRRRGAK